MRTSFTIGKIVAICSFSVFVLLGTLLYQDYGVSFDEISHLEGAEQNYKLITEGRPLPTDRDWRHYGPVFDLSVFMVSRALSLDDIRSNLLLKHLLTFLFYCLALACFYLLCRDYFGNWIPAYFACVLMVVHPRIFADSFYNPKDLPFMSSAMISVFTMLRFLDKPTLMRGIVHAATCAICIDIRIIGVFFPAITAFVAAADELSDKSRSIARASRVGAYAVFFVSLIAFTILFWPHLWASPISRFMETLSFMTRFPWPEKVLYFGEMVPATDLPRHYLPVWILIATPLSVTVFLVIGLFELPFVVNKWLKADRNSAAVFVPYIWFGAPLLAAIVLRPTMYDGWRQFYFLYPPMAMIAAKGAVWLRGSIASIGRKGLKQLTRIVVVLVVLIDLGATVLFMVRAHPNQNVYFNGLVAGVRGAEASFELDYWGLSYRQMLEELLRRNKGAGPILISGSELPVELNTFILPRDQRDRLVYHQTPETIPGDAEYYFLSTFRNMPREWLEKHPPLFTVLVDGAVIGAIFRIEPGRVSGKKGNGARTQDNAPLTSH